MAITAKFEPPLQQFSDNPSNIPDDFIKNPLILILILTNKNMLLICERLLTHILTTGSMRYKGAIL